MGRLRQRDRESHGKCSSTRGEQNASRGLILRCIAIIHTILLSRLVRGLWGWRDGGPSLGGAGNPKSLHFVSEGCPLQAQAGGCSVRATDHPVAFAERPQDLR